jgi:FAD/FMN-containing dehydrogenase/Fe-S oxidoreductase
MSATAAPTPTPATNPTDRNGRDRRAALETARVLQAELDARVDGEVRFDRTSRMLYSTDASNYQIEPIGVVVPKSIDDVQASIELASSHGVPIVARGGGSGLAGQAVGTGLIIDFSKYLNRVLEVDTEAQRVTVEPGINLDLLNKQMRPSGLMYGPDPSSSNRATIGGVISNNASGAHSILFGMTSDSLHSLRLALVDGGTADLGPGSIEDLRGLAGVDDPRGRLMTKLLAFREQHSELIARDFPRHWRRATGYSLDEFVKADGVFNPARLIASSEGTLGTVLGATLSLVPLPKQTAIVLLQFDELVPAMAATAAILEVEPAAIELMDRMLIELTREQPLYASQLTYLEGVPEAVLAVEFFGESERELNAKCQRLEDHLTQRGIKLRVPPLRMLDPKRQADMWSVRKAGLGLLMSIKGDYKPIPVIEDVSVPVEHLAEYVGAIQQMVASYDTRAAFYAHASAGCLHIRPLINLKEVRGVEIMHEMAYAAADLAHRFGGVMSGEHGDGLQRSELNEKIFGPELYQVMRDFKHLFDPRGLMNPGKKVNGPPLVENLRYGPSYTPLQIKTNLDFSREGGFLGAVEMCNGAAVCRKLKAGTMCPSYMATKDEKDTTRGRANALRNALAGRTFSPEEFTSKETYEVMDLCLSCKACKTECPSSVDMAKIKTEFLAQYQERHGIPLRSRVMGNIHRISKMSAPIAPLANLAMRSPLSRPAMSALGIHPERRMSAFQRQTFISKWRKHQKTILPRQTRGKVVYFHDTFATYNYPNIAMSAVRLLEAAGFEVVIEERRACCGRPMLSKGLVDEARRAARRNVSLLAAHAHAGTPIIGTEPSCILTLRDEYLDLLPGDANAQVVAKNSFMIDEFLANLEKEGTLGIGWSARQGPEVLFHGHCHQKALIGMAPSMTILKSSGCTVQETGAGCCGMAGSFGYETEHYEVSKKIGEERLFPKVESVNRQTVVAVAGVSCRQQIEHFTDRRTQHIAEVLASRIKPGHVWQAPVSVPATAAD